MKEKERDRMGECLDSDVVQVIMYDNRLFIIIITVDFRGKNTGK